MLQHGIVTDLKCLFLDAGAGMNSIIEQSSVVGKEPDEQTKEIFRPYRVFCARKDVSFTFFQDRKQEEKNYKKILASITSS